MCILAFLFCSSLVKVSAQSTAATLSGTVEDEAGAVVPGVLVAILNVDTSLRREATTNDSGSFIFTLLSPGRYSVSAERQGFKPIQIPNVVLNVGDQKALQIKLVAGNITEAVLVNADAALINESPAVGTVVDRQFVENIPLNGRSFQSLITLTPGVVVVPGGVTNTAGQFSVNGQRPSANSFIVDGVSANFGAAPGGFGQSQSSGNLPALTTFGTTQSLVSVDALQEFKIQTSTYAAEFGRQPGGQVSIVTRSGSNEFHGSLFDYIRNEAFDANDWFANRAGQPKPPMRQNDFGGTFSGPVFLPRFGEGGPSWYNGRDRTFFFFSYEGLRLRLPQFNLTNVPSRCLRGLGGCSAGQSAAPAAIQPILNAFPLPNGRDLANGFAEFNASYSDQATLDATSLRIDHSFNKAFSVFGRFNIAPSESLRRFGESLSELSSSRLGTKTFTIGVITSIRATAINDLRINYSDNGAYVSRQQDGFGGAIPLPPGTLIPSLFEGPSTQGAVTFNLPGRTSSSVPQLSITSENVATQRQFTVVDGFSYIKNSHHFKFGFDYRRLTPIVAFNLYFLGTTFSSQQQVLTATAGTGNIGAGLQLRPVFTNFSAYGQDSWRLSSRLTLDLGIRWDVNPAPSEANGRDQVAVTQITDLTSMQLAPLGTKAWKTTYNNFGPRVGIAYQLIEKAGRETVIRGGFGLFYDSGNDTAARNFNQRFPYTSTRFLTNIAYPLNPAQVAPAPLPIQTGLTTPYPTFFAFDPNLRLPYTWQWSLAAQQSLGMNQALSVSYVGAAGRRLLQASRLFGIGAINPRFTDVTLTTNNATSDYNAMQIQFQRRLSRGFQALASYTWSHSLDDDSSSETARTAQRGNSSFDVRHVFAAAATYDFPKFGRSRLVRAILGHWSIDTRIQAQSALPVDLIATFLTNPADGSLTNVRPNVIPGVALYLFGSQYPGGRTINNTPPSAAQIAAAGCSATGPAKGPFCTPLAGQSGNLGRNQVRGLPAWQIDAALRREFNLTEKLKLQFRAEAFNVFNHPNFGTIQTTLSAANFGQATNMLNRQLGGINQLYQIGGPRSLQFALKLLF